MLEPEGVAGLMAPPVAAAVAAERKVMVFLLRQVQPEQEERHLAEPLLLHQLLVAGVVPLEQMVPLLLAQVFTVGVVVVGGQHKIQVSLPEVVTPLMVLGVVVGALESMRFIQLLVMADGEEQMSKKLIQH